MNTTETLAAFVADISYEQLPGEVVERAKRQSLDLIGAVLVGTTQEAGRLAGDFATRFGSSPEATVWGRDKRTSPPEAAFANGVAGHATEFDDMWLPGADPTAPIFCAAFAVAESIGASGKELIAAQIAGYEVMGRLHFAANGRAGWHPTGVFGTFGATAASSRLLGLTAKQTANAIGIASSSASGIDAQGGSMSKPFHAGQAARNGVAAAMLAQSGFTANDAVFDSKRNFFTAFYRDLPIQPWRLTADLGITFHIINPGIGIKMWPAGYHMHQAFEAALQLVLEYDITPDEVEDVMIGIRPGSRFDRPDVNVGLAGKFSLQYVAALAIVERNLTVKSFDDEVTQSEQVKGLLRKIHVKADASIPDNPDIWFNPVTIRTKDGRVMTASVPLPKSHWRYPLRREEWLGKFENNASTVLDEKTIRQLVDAIDHLENVDDVRSVGKLMFTGER